MTKKKIVEFYKFGLKSEKQIRQEYGVTPLLLEKLVRWYNRYFLNPQKNYFQTVKSRTMGRPPYQKKVWHQTVQKVIQENPEGSVQEISRNCQTNQRAPTPL